MTEVRIWQEGIACKTGLVIPGLNSIIGDDAIDPKEKAPLERGF